MWKIFNREKDIEWLLKDQLDESHVRTRINSNRLLHLEIHISGEEEGFSGCNMLVILSLLFLVYPIFLSLSLLSQLRRTHVHARLNLFVFF